MSFVLTFFLVPLTFYGSEEMIKNEQTPLESCRSSKHLKDVAEYVKLKGTLSKPSREFIADSKMEAMNVTFEEWSLWLIEYKSSSQKLIIVKEDGEAIPIYQAKIQNEKVLLSSYAARLDQESDISRRAQDWCKLLKKLTSEE
ncbi:MAG: hypothetical protein AAF789_03425 [Bacteroidota bacterium]